MKDGSEKPFVLDGRKKILSLDGGGMRGVITLSMLSELEKISNKPTHEIFDMVGGTSTGAIIAAGLAVGMTAQEILHIYKKYLAKVFSRSGASKWLNFLLNGFRHLYEAEPFVDALKPYVKDKKIGEIEYPIVLITTKDVRTGNTYYITSAGEGVNMFKDWYLADAVQASVSAPVYFPPFKGNFIDGGIGIHGNPSLAIVTEAMEYIGPDEGFVDGNVILVSLGTGYVPNTYRDRVAGEWNAVNWLNYVLSEFMDDSAFQQAMSTRAIYGNRIDVRRYNPYLHWDIYDMLGIPAMVDEDGEINFSKNINPSTLSLDTSDNHSVELMELIGKMYAKNIDWSISNVMPWDTLGGHPKPSIDPSLYRIREE